MNHLPEAGSSFAVAGVRVAHWTDRTGATGCTVVLCPEGGAVAACSALGGAPGSHETDALRPGNLVQKVDAILLTGGSAFGLAATTGVVRWLEERGRGFVTRAGRVPIVPAAVVYDLAVGDARARPDERAGYLACEAALADATIAEGSVGAGTGATVAKVAGSERAVKGGVGMAFERLAGGAVVAALVVANASGDIYDVESGRPIAVARADESGKRRGAIDLLRERLPQEDGPFNTTLTIVATDAPFDRMELLRIAEMTHAGLARAIVPYLGPGDGDIVFALSTGAGPRADLTATGALAGYAAARAVARAVRLAESVAGVPAVRDLGEP